MQGGVSVLFGRDGRVFVSKNGKTVESRSPVSKQEAESIIGLLDEKD